MSECQTKAGNQECFEKLENFENIKNDPWDMLDNFCFHVYAVYCRKLQCFFHHHHHHPLL